MDTLIGRAARHLLPIGRRPFRCASWVSFDRFASPPEAVAGRERASEGVAAFL